MKMDRKYAMWGKQARRDKKDGTEEGEGSEGQREEMREGERRE